jgi:hypothetical protein
MITPALNLITFLLSELTINSSMELEVFVANPVLHSFLETRMRILRAISSVEDIVSSSNN